ncbi:MAG: lantibiotic dehydratase [Acidobacteria bacterium]|nr:lantibiotic dehydratase [Acidobacteriota bacterium]
MASPDLESALEHWLRDPDSEKGERAERAAVKYFSRMSGRATPFGLFAGGCTGLLGEKTRLVLAPRETSKRHSRLDMDYLFVLSEAINGDHALRSSLGFRLNSTLYRAGERYRYVESRVHKHERTYHLVAVEATPHLQKILERAERGARLEDLAASLVDENITAQEARSYVNELADSQILIPDTGMVITGREPASLMAERLGQFAETRVIGSRLQDVNHQLDVIDAGGLGAAPGRYRELVALLRDLPAKPELARLFQVDLMKTGVNVSLGKAVAEEVRRGIEVLHRLSTPRNSPLPAFREAFTERYEEREIPLVEALDEERGIGFPAFQDEDAAQAPLLVGIRFPKAHDDSVSWGPREALLLRKVGQALARDEDEMLLDDAALEILTNRERLPLPSVFGALVRLVASSDEELDRGNFRIHLESAGGPSGATFLGRFCHGDQDLCRLVEEHLKAEKALEPDALLAEVVHLPDGRTGNVISRPLFHDYEIPFLGSSGAPLERQIPVSDLLISVRGGEIQLRSKRHGQRILPRLTTAHNYARYGLSLYRFLCALQAQTTTAGLAWRWGPLSSLPFLPRVRYGRTVLAPAQWNVETSELKELGKRLDGRGFDALRRWRREHRIPRFVMFGTTHEIPVDFDSVLSAEAFLSLVRNGEPVELREMLPGPEELCARGPEGRYVHELLIPFVGQSSAASRPLQPSPERARRTFLPGSEWLYAKFYGGNVTLDQALVKTIGPFAASVVASGTADSWFFVRYADPRPHLQIRFRGDSARLRESILPDLNRMAEGLASRGQIWRMQIDTYEREIERYGGVEGVEIAERFFHFDSETVLTILKMLEHGEAGHNERWHMALLGTDALLEDFGLSFEEKRKFSAQAQQALGAGKDEDPDFRRTLGDRYRKDGRGLLPLLERKGLEESSLWPGLQVLSQRSRRTAPLVEELRSLEATARLDRPVRAAAASYVHVFLNRVFLTAHRKQELVVYDFLNRLYDAMASRGLASR